LLTDEVAMPGKCMGAHAPHPQNDIPSTPRSLLPGSSASLPLFHHCIITLLHIDKLSGTSPN
jgi:hypothetical protein